MLLLGACVEPPPPQPLATCASGKIHVGTSENQDMTPGQACNACHAQANAASGDNEIPIYGFAGTVFTYKHEPDDCVGGALDDAQVIVEVVDATDRLYQVALTRTGNFMFEGVVTPPLTARVIYRGRTRWMIEPQMSGDCNTCHSAEGSDFASGRIRLP